MGGFILYNHLAGPWFPPGDLDSGFRRNDEQKEHRTIRFALMRLMSEKLM